MAKIWNYITSEESGQGMVEYGLIIALIAVALIVTLTALSGGLSALFTKVTTQLNTSAA